MTPEQSQEPPPEEVQPSFDRVLSGRRMCRDFTGASIEASVLNAVLVAAMRGPTAGNASALDLVVLEGDETSRYWDLTLPGDRRRTFRWPGLLVAPVLVLPTVDPGAYVARYAEPDKAGAGLGETEDAWPVPYWFVDGGSAVMALLLAAERHGLGALFFGQFGHEPTLLDAFGVPPGRRCLGTIALGHPAPGGRRAVASALRRRPDPQTRIHRGGW